MTSNNCYYSHNNQDETLAGAWTWDGNTDIDDNDFYPFLAGSASLQTQHEGPAVYSYTPTSLPAAQYPPLPGQDSTSGRYSQYAPTSHHLDMGRSYAQAVQNDSPSETQGAPQGCWQTPSSAMSTSSASLYQQEAEHRQVRASVYRQIEEQRRASVSQASGGNGHASAYANGPSSNVPHPPRWTYQVPGRQESPFGHANLTAQHASSQRDPAVQRQAMVPKSAGQEVLQPSGAVSHLSSTNLLQVNQVHHAGPMMNFLCERRTVAERAGILGSELASPMSTALSPSGSEGQSPRSRRSKVEMRSDGSSERCNHPGCGLGFDDREGLRHHQHNAHTDSASRPWPCDVPECRKSFMYPKDRERHRRDVHISARDFICTVIGCGKGYKRKDALSRHMRNEHNVA